MYMPKLLRQILGFPSESVKQGAEKLRADLAISMTSDDMRDETYREIYGDDEEAIRKAKESWRRAGQAVLDDFDRMTNNEFKP